MSETLTLPSGRTVARGEEISVIDPLAQQRRRYRLHRVEANGDVTVWGPIDTSGLTPHGSMRSFRATQIVDRKHYKPRSRHMRQSADI